MFALRCVLRLKGLSGNPPGGRRASYACTNPAILLLFAQQPVFLNVSPVFVYFVCCIIINTLCVVGFLPVRWYPQLLVDILCASTVSAPRRTSRCSRRSAVLLLHLPARLTHERFHGDTQGILQRLRNFNNLVDGLQLRHLDGFLLNPRHCTSPA